LPEPPTPPKPLTLVILSGGTGRTAEQVLNAALAQFEQPSVRVVMRTQIRTPAAARRVIAEAERDQAIVFQTLVTPKVREAAMEEHERRGVPMVDILGPVLMALADHLPQPPRRQAGLSYEVQQEHFDRLDAVDFTLAHDDGQRLHDLDQADVVLVGPSRVSKSVTCFYLAYHGVRAANVPLFAGREPPEELLRIAPQKVIALTMNAYRLRSIRQIRAERVHPSRHVLGEYAELRAVAEDLNHTQKLIEQHGWRHIDVCYMSVEEVAESILSMTPC
jgi:regulator of PEP synthase PpsR (kinase-PPPase family)